MDRWALKRAFRYLEAIFFIVGAFAGFLAFILVPLSLSLIIYHGGSAISGYQQAGAYFLTDHGKSYQVAPATFVRMLFIERAAIASAVLFAFIGISALVAGKLGEWRTRVGWRSRHQF